MSLLDDAVHAAIRAMEERGFSPETTLTARALGIREAIGDPSPYKDFALLRGVEKLMDVEIDGHHGQAFTSEPSHWTGTVGQALQMPLLSDRRRALAAGTINALVSVWGLSDRTVHCRDDGPDTCGQEVAGLLERELEPQDILAVIGYQPALLRHLSERLGSGRIRVTDLNRENVGHVRYDVEIWDGDRDLERLAHAGTLCLATGSTVINGTADRILDAFGATGKDVIFFGTSISGTAALLGLRHLCPRSR